MEFLPGQLLPFLKDFGLLAFFAASAAGSAMLPAPGWAVALLAGFLASLGLFPLWLLVLVSTAGNLAGSLVVYQAGRRMGWLHDFPPLETDLKLTQHLFDRHGHKTVFFGQIIPSVRTFIAIPAGIAGVPLWEFSVLVFMGAMVWNSVLGCVGFALGESWSLVSAYGRYMAVFMTLAFPLAYLLYRRSAREKLENL